MATDGNIGQRTFMAWVHNIRKYRYDHWWIYFGRQVSLFLDYFLITDFFSDKEAEIWNLTDETNKVINPTIPNGDYKFGIGLYIVPFNFCTT